ncbi:MAG: NYN domain-containing protein [Candidatus Omnitrophica bacterium]|nr:NYN domain-containing protein [Candidatus Omnitrophota bacterium]
MRTFVIDGYNVIYAIPQIEELLDESLEAARLGLERLLARFKDSRKDIENIYVVFDGQAQTSDEERPLANGITAIYTHTKKNADEKILEIVKDSKRPDLITVVSNDNFLYNNTRIHGGHIITVGEFCRIMKL